jgi:prepilin-type N-terminal cleavage/methylation domain-containing protein
MNMKRLHKDQRGLTIIELLVVIVLTGLITAAITTTFFQVFNMNARTANHMSALSQVQHAGKLVSEDILQSQEQTAEGATGFPLSLNWTEGGMSGDSHEIIYTLEDMPSGELKRLQREQKINLVLESITIVAEYIDPDQTSCVPIGDAFKFTVTATVGEGTWGEESETRIYRVQPRPGT